MISIDKSKLYGLLSPVLLLIIFLSSCATRYVHMPAQRPAFITVPKEVQTLLILDRALPEDKQKEVIGSILSANMPGDRDAGVQAFFKGIEDQINFSGRFEIIKATEALPGNNVSSVFPDPLNWEQIKFLCEKYNADAMITLEVYSTKFLITNGTRMVTKDVNGVNLPLPQIYAKGVATADIGIRFYDPAIEKIVDEMTFSQKSDWEASGGSVADAIKLLIDKTEAVKGVSYDAGVRYGIRIAPRPITITREFYQKPKRNESLARGRRQADARLWKDAAETWQNGISSANRKTAGRLAYNTAVAYEVLGEFDLAIEWAQKAYVDYGNKKAKEYSDMLHYRLRQENILDDQR